MAFQNLRIEIISLVHVQVADDILLRFRFHHPLIQRDVMKELFLFMILEVVDYCDDWRCVL